MNEMEKQTKNYAGQVQFLSEIQKGAEASGKDVFTEMGKALQLLLRIGDINVEQFGQLVHTMTSGFSDAEREIQKADSALK